MHRVEFFELKIRISPPKRIFQQTLLIFEYLRQKESFSKPILDCLSAALVGWIHEEKNATRSRDSATLTFLNCSISFSYVNNSTLQCAVSSCVRNSWDRNSCAVNTKQLCSKHCLLNSCCWHNCFPTPHGGKNSRKSWSWSSRNALFTEHKNESFSAKMNAD